MRNQIFAVILSMLTCSSGAFAGQIAYVLQRNTLFEVDLQSGSVNSIGYLGTGPYMSHLGFGPDGVLYGITDENALFSIDRATAQVSMVGVVPLSGDHRPLGLATDRNGRFLLLTSDYYFSYIFALDLSSAAAVQLLTIDSYWLTGIAPKGTSIFTIDRPCSICTIDPISGDLESLPESPDCGYYESLSDLAFDERGHLWGMKCNGHFGDQIEWGRISTTTGSFEGQFSVNNFDCPDSMAITSQASFPIPESGLTGRLILIALLAISGIALLILRRAL